MRWPTYILGIGAGLARGVERGFERRRQKEITDWNKFMMAVELGIAPKTEEEAIAQGYSRNIAKLAPAAEQRRIRTSQTEIAGLIEKQLAADPTITEEDILNTIRTLAPRYGLTEEQAMASITPYPMRPELTIPGFPRTF
ncbi:MAG: hypothetical protein AB1478_02715, partial [Nitrospirota bacterium]